MRVVVVGAGAVGVCYAERLVRGGAEVAFRVRRPAEVPRRFVVWELGIASVTKRVFAAEVFGTDAEVAAFRPDVILLTVPTDALRTGDWLRPLLDAAGEALVVALEPGLEDARVLREARPDVRLAQGIIALIAYQAPLPGETRFDEPGVAVYAPLSCPFAGDGVAPFVEALRAGGLRCSIAQDLSQESGFGTIVMAVWVTALRAGGFTFAGLKETGELGHQAALEGADVVSKQLSKPVPRWVWWLGPRTLRAALAVGARVLPLPLETYLRVHFTKVGAQTRMHLCDLVEDGRRRSLPVGAVAALLERADERSPLPGKA